MHTEHLQNVKPITVVAAWLIAIAVTSLIMLAMVGLNVVDSEAPSARAAMGALALGFAAGGAFAGLRAARAPILHGIAMGMFSLIAWFVLGLVSSTLLDGAGWDATRDITIAALIVQIVCSIIGARLGYRFATRGNV